MYRIRALGDDADQEDEVLTVEQVNIPILNAIHRFILTASFSQNIIAKSEYDRALHIKNDGRDDDAAFLWSELLTAKVISDVKYARRFIEIEFINCFHFDRLKRIIKHMICIV